VTASAPAAFPATARHLDHGGQFDKILLLAIDRVPLWSTMPASLKPTPIIIVGGHFFAFIAGSVNMTGMLSVVHASVSHTTGAVSQLALAIAQADAQLAVRMSVVVLAFLSGAVISGFFTGGGKFAPRKRYGLMIMLEGACLAGAATAFLQGRPLPGETLAALACGIQNGMVSLVSGAIVRTTHMTGIVTDIGTNLGLLLSSRKVAGRRLVLHIAILTGFVLGALTCATIYYHFTARGPSLLMLAIAAVLILMGSAYFVMRRLAPQRLERIFEYHA
jgi:uncharacterized membrane protein YoaK (UPF0700 family)